MADRPGVLFYFTDWEPLLVLDDTALAELFRAALRYAQYGEVPDFEGTSAIFWRLIAPKIDRDGERYRSTCESAKYSVYCREEKKAGRTPLTREEWEHRSISNDIQLQPQSQSQSQSQQQGQGQEQGDQRGEGKGDNSSLPPIYHVMPEDEFEKKRQEMLNMLERARSGKP